MSKKMSSNALFGSGISKLNSSHYSTMRIWPCC